MEHRRLGSSGLRVPVLSFGTATFGGLYEYEAVGNTDVEEASRLVDICLDNGITMFDTANQYSRGRAEEILGEAVASRRDEVLIATKATAPMGSGPNEGGSSRFHLVQAVEESLRRLKTDRIDLLYMHLFDATTPVEEVLHTLEVLVSSGKVRYIGASNFPAWALMKSLSAAERHGWSRYVAHQVQYSLAVRNYEYELAPLGADQGVGATIFSPLATSALTGKIRRGQEIPAESRLSKGAIDYLPAELDKVYEIVDALDEVALETDRSLSQIALNWLLQKPTVSSIIIGARTEEQLRDNVGAVGWSLTPAQVERLDQASSLPLPYPYNEQQHFPQFSLSHWPV